MNGIQTFDFAVLNWIQQNLKGHLLDFWMPLITSLGNNGVLFIVLTLVMLCSKRWRRQSRAMAAALVLCLVVGNLLLKPLVARTRPYDLVQGIKLLVPPLSDYSFPSGHTMISTAFAVVFWKYRKTFKAWAWVMTILAVLIAFSRLYLYVHFPTDVLCGALIGALLALAAVHFGEWWYGKDTLKNRK